MKKVVNIAKNKDFKTRLYIKKIFKRSMKSKLRKLNTTFYSDICVFLFFLVGFFLINILIYLRLTSKLLKESINNQINSDELQIVNTESSLQFMLFVLEISVFIGVIGLFIFGVFRLFIHLIQIINIEKDDIKAKTLIGATPLYVAFETAIEEFFLVPIFLLLGFVLSKSIFGILLLKLSNVFPIENIFINELHTINIKILFIGILIILFLFFIYTFYAKKKIYKITIVN